MNPRWTIAVTACACVAVGVYAYGVDPSAGGYPQCLLYQATGYYCAGCGATRAVHALLHGRVFEALHDNVLFVMLLPVVMAMVVPFAMRAWRENKWPSIRLGQRSIAVRGVAIVAIALVFMAVRNVPGPAFDWLRPLA